MATDRPEKSGGGFVEVVEGRRLSMPVFIELARIKLSSGQSWGGRASGKGKGGTLPIFPAAAKAG
jgi:hypothetical protein